ncbi:type III secretion system needle filament subunit SctF [Mycetohabitans sp. B46]|uniref:type III secretion system needle filament subunit SctF n=1 Tax=Mycetohabitans sp. B46 TaxID=2772536 RepID=UPI00307DDD34
MDHYNYYIESANKIFYNNTQKLKDKLDAALKDLAREPDNPTLIAQYQAICSEYTLYRNAQSNMIKSFKDTDSAIIANFR